MNRINMRRIYHPYWLWEDYQNGLFNLTTDNDDHYIMESKLLLINSKQLHSAMIFVAFNWHHTAEVNLSNNNRNHQAWLGQAACLYFCKSPEYITKKAWHLLNDTEQTKANEIADNVYKQWIYSRIEICQKSLWE